MDNKNLNIDQACAQFETILNNLSESITIELHINESINLNELHPGMCKLEISKKIRGIFLSALN